MKHTAKKTMITVIGGLLVFIGVMFVIVPGPAILFLPAGLALLSLEYPWAKQWLKKCQRLMRKGAEQMDNLVVSLKRRSN